MNYSNKIPKNINLKVIITVLAISGLTGCATESQKKLEVSKVESFGTVFNKADRTSIIVGNFQNRSNYLRGLFSSNTDRLGNQAKTILHTHLQQSNRFKLLDRQSTEINAAEAKLIGTKQNIQGARYSISGQVTEFGRKVTGDKQFFGILGTGKKQIAYSKVSLNVTDVLTSEIVYAVQGAAEFELSNREILGFGGTASYDSTLNGKVLNLAIQEAVNNMVKDIDSGNWVTEK